MDRAVVFGLALAALYHPYNWAMVGIAAATAWADQESVWVKAAIIAVLSIAIHLAHLQRWVTIGGVIPATYVTVSKATLVALAMWTGIVMARSNKRPPAG